LCLLKEYAKFFKITVIKPVGHTQFQDNILVFNKLCVKTADFPGIGSKNPIRYRGADLNCRPPTGGYKSDAANKKDPWWGLKNVSRSRLELPTFGL
jgi:hypothetical protein